MQANEVKIYAEMKAIEVHQASRDKYTELESYWQKEAISANAHGQSDLFELCIEQRASNAAEVGRYHRAMHNSMRNLNSLRVAAYSHHA